MTDQENALPRKFIHHLLPSLYGASLRMVVSPGREAEGILHMPAGQSGHPLSRHYDDLGELWRRGEYIPMTLDPGLARAGAIGINRLVPEQ